MECLSYGVSVYRESRNWFINISRYALCTETVFVSISEFVNTNVKNHKKTRLLF